MPEQDSATTDVNPMDALDFSTEEESPIKADTPAADAPSAEENKETTDPKEETEGEQEPEKSEGDEEEQPADETEQEDESKPKNSAQNRIRSLANEKRALQQEVERLNSLVYQPQTAEQLQEDGMDETQAQVEALRQERLMDKANQHITELNSDLNMEALQVTHDFPIFDPESDKYDKDFAETVSKQWQVAAGIQLDPNTNLVTQARVLPYDFYKSYAEARELGVKKGAINGKRDYERQANAADITPIASPKDEKKDPLMEALLAD